MIKNALFGLLATALVSVSMAQDVAIPAITARPLSAIAVSQCGLAVALFIQLDATHLLRADPRQSDLFVADNGEMIQQTAGPMKWEDAIGIARSAVITTHVVLPCTEGPTV